MDSCSYSCGPWLIRMTRIGPAASAVGSRGGGAFDHETDEGHERKVVTTNDLYDSYARLSLRMTCMKGCSYSCGSCGSWLIRMTRIGPAASAVGSRGGGAFDYETSEGYERTVVTAYDLYDCLTCSQWRRPGAEPAG